jgi:integrase
LGRKQPIFPFPPKQFYSKSIQPLLKAVGIDRIVQVYDTTTSETVAKHLYEVATTHTARKTFIANLYKKVKDSEQVAAMSGHSEGSRAFARYRQIDDEMKREIVELID